MFPNGHEIVNRILFSSKNYLNMIYQSLFSTNKIVYIPTIVGIGIVCQSDQ